MLNNYNTLENANLYEKQFLKKVGDLPYKTSIYTLNNENEVSQYVIENKTERIVELYSPRCYAKWCNEITINGKVFTFDESLDGLMKAREFFADKTFGKKDSIETRRYISEPVKYTNDPNTIHFYFNTYLINKKELIIKIEYDEDKNENTFIPIDSYVIPFDYFSINQNMKLIKSVYRIAKYKHENPNTYEICNYLIYSKDTSEQKNQVLKQLEKLHVDNYYVVDVSYNKILDNLTVRIDDIKIDLDFKVSKEVVELLDLQEPHRCSCRNCVYRDIGCPCRLLDDTPCRGYTPNHSYKLFRELWDKSSDETKREYRDFMKMHITEVLVKTSSTNSCWIGYYTKNKDVFKRTSRDIKAEYKVTYNRRKKKNQRTVEYLV